MCAMHHRNTNTHTHTHEHEGGLIAWKGVTTDPCDDKHTHTHERERSAEEDRRQALTLYDYSIGCFERKRSAAAAADVGRFLSVVGVGWLAVWLALSVGWDPKTWYIETKLDETRRSEIYESEGVYTMLFRALLARLSVTLAQ